MKAWWLLLCILASVTRADEVLWIEQQDLKQAEKWRQQGFELAVDWLSINDLKVNYRDAGNIYEYKPGWLSLVDVIVAPLKPSDVWQLSELPSDTPVILPPGLPDELVDGFLGREVWELGLTSQQWVELVARWLLGNELTVISSRASVDTMVANRLAALGVSVEFYGAQTDWSQIKVADRVLVLWHQKNHPGNKLQSTLVITPSQQAYLGAAKSELQLITSYSPWVLRNGLNDWFVLNYQEKYAALPNQYAAMGFATGLVLAQRGQSEEVLGLNEQPIATKVLDRLYIIAGEKQSSKVIDELVYSELVEK